MKVCVQISFDVIKMHDCKRVFFISSESTSTADQGEGSLCSSTLEKLKSFACLTSESSVGHGAIVKHRTTLDDAEVKVPDRTSLIDMEQCPKEHKFEKLEENEEEKGRSQVTDSEQVQASRCHYCKIWSNIFTQE